MFWLLLNLPARNHCIGLLVFQFSCKEALNKPTNQIWSAIINNNNSFISTTLITINFIAFPSKQIHSVLNQVSFIRRIIYWIPNYDRYKMVIQKYERYKMVIQAFIIKVNDSLLVLSFYNVSMEFYLPGGPKKSKYYSAHTHQKTLLLALSIIIVITYLGY